MPVQVTTGRRWGTHLDKDLWLVLDVAICQEHHEGHVDVSGAEDFDDHSSLLLSVGLMELSSRQ
jgi:hypothetical protein